jgi:replicative DNA helicase
MADGDPRGGRRDSARIPPHNLDAEASVLGAMLLSVDAVGSVSETGLVPGDFYRPANQHIFDAIRSLYTTGEPIDPITVADVLRRGSLLDEAGGAEALHELQNATPAISSARHYAKIVQDTAILRRLIRAAGDIAELAYGGPDDVTKAVDQAESTVFHVAEDRVADTTRPIKDLIDQTMDRLELAYERGTTITGAPTGYHDVDELLSGLQRSTLNIVGARPAMGKCVAWDTPIVDAATGAVVTAAELFDRAMGRTSLEVFALGPDGRLGRANVSACIDDGTKPVFTVRTRSGREVTITASHPLLTADGWRPLGEVRVGAPIAVPRELPIFGTGELADAAIDRLADAVGDGGAETSMPAEVARLSRPRLARLLNRVFARGGTAWVSSEGAHIDFVTRSQEVARHVAHLLLRFGVVSRLHERRTTVLEPWGAEYRPAYEVQVVEGASIMRLIDEIGIVGLDQQLAEVRERAAEGTPADDGVLPRQVWDDVNKARGELSWAELSRRCPLPAGTDGSPHGAPLRRDVVARLAEALDDDRLRWWSSPDVVWDDIVSIEPAGETRVIDFSVPGLHNFVAADLYLHNTAFGLGMAVNVARELHQPVLVFSLEMGHDELTQRIVSSEARVDSSKLRTGRLNEADWGKIGHAIGRLEVPLFLDDNPQLTVMEIRAKARRIKARHGSLALIVVDYLQLMSSPGRVENRQLEISEISRNLKVLARELETPIVALSQLSRNLESRADKRPMLSDLRESGCLTADTRVLRADTNAEVTLGELVASGERNVPVWSLDRDLRMVPATMTQAFPSGVKQVFSLRLASGRVVKASANHPFLTVRGWQRLDELVVGSRIAVPRVVPDPLRPGSWPDDHVILLAHLLGDGCFASKQPLHYTSGDPANIDVVEKAALSFGIQSRRVPQNTYMHLYLSAGRGLARGRRNPIAAWLDGFGLYGLRSHEKFVPREVFGLPLRQVGLFLHHLWATDGSLGVFKLGNGDRPRIYYASTSRRLIDDVQLLLSRFGILSRIVVTRKAGHRVGYQLLIVGSVGMRTFLEEIGVHGARGELVSIVRARVGETTKDAYCDALPDEVTPLVLGAIKQSGLSHAEVSRRAAMGRYRADRAPVPRWRLERLANVLGDDFLHMLASSDVHWDRVVDIVPLGEQPVFDATVEETHNFVANGITVENSLEQDADVVMFLYRDEVYNNESPDKGSAEVIVAKHRSGPIGTRRLVWLGQYTRFENAARRADL